MKPGKEELLEYLKVLKKVRRLRFFSSVAVTEWIFYGIASPIEIKILQEMDEAHIIMLFPVDEGISGFTSTPKTYFEDVKFKLLDIVELEKDLEFVEKEISKLETVSSPVIPKEKTLEIKTDNKLETDIEYRITFESGDIRINGKLISRPNFDSENDLVFNYLYSNPNKKFTREQIELSVKPKPTKSFNKIVENLGFTKNLRKYFFKVSDRSIQFNNPVKTKEKLI